jgi:hypothetical protein
MRCRHILALLLFLGSIEAQEVRLGPEVPISGIGALGAAAGLQDRPRVATNGSGFLLSWRVPGGIQLLPADRATYPVNIDAHSNAHVIASDGIDYLLVWSNESGLYTLRVDENGRALSTKNALGRLPQVVAIASNGSTYLVATDEGHLLLLDRDGNLVRAYDERLARVLHLGVRADGAYEAIDRLDASGTKVRVHTIGTRVTSAELTGVQGRNLIVAAAANDDAIAVAWTSLGTGFSNIHIYGRNGNLRAWHEVSHAPVSDLAAATDGKDFLFLVGRSAVEQTYSVRVTQRGEIDKTLLDFEAVHVASNRLRALAVGTRTARSDKDVVGRSMPGFAAIASAPTTTLSLAHARQHSPRIARAGENELAVWIDSGTQTIAGQVNGKPFRITPAKALLSTAGVAAGRHNFVVAWYELHVYNADLVASRISFDGEVLDRVHVRTVSYSSRAQPAVVYARDAYLFAIADRRDVHVARMSDEAVIEHVRTIPVLGFDYAASASLVWTGRDALIAFVAYWVTPSPQTGVTELAVTLLGSETILVLSELGFFQELDHPVAIAYGAGGRIAIAGTHFVMLLTAEGTLLHEQTLGTGNTPQLVWNGSEYVMAWIEDRAVRVRRFDANMLPVDPRPVDIGVAAIAWGPPPAMVVTAEGVKIAYEAADGEHGDAVRIVSRTLERLPPSRKRAVR